VRPRSGGGTTELFSLAPRAIQVASVLNDELVTSMRGPPAWGMSVVTMIGSGPSHVVIRTENGGSTFASRPGIRYGP